MREAKLYSYWRSSAAYRVRIALNLKGLSYDYVAVNLAGDGEQHSVAYHAVNPQELVPVLIDGVRVIRQSQAIIEYLDETYEGQAKLLPATARDRARVRALAQMVACDIHPLNNTRVMKYLEHEFNAPPIERAKKAGGILIIDRLRECRRNPKGCYCQHQPSLKRAHRPNAALCLLRLDRWFGHGDPPHTEAMQSPPTVCC